MLEFTKATCDERQHPLMAHARRREKEVVAVAFNQKEQRVLEKSLATIQLEAAYSLKLLDLDNRTVKVHFRQMKDKVSRIKSYLTPDEISKLRRLEAEGKLTPMYPPVSPGSAMKIAAAARRLHSSYGVRTPPGYRQPPRAKSALPRVNLPNGSHQAPTPGPLKRSNSVSGAFIDAPKARNNNRPGSAGHLLGVRKGITPAATAVKSPPDVKVHTDSYYSKHDQVTNGSTAWVNGNRTAAVMASKLPDTIAASTLALIAKESRPGSSIMKTEATTAQNHQQQHLHFAVHNNVDSSFSTTSVDSQALKRTGTRSSITNGHAPNHGPSFDQDRHGSAHSCGTIYSHHSRAPFSSHVATEKDAKEREDQRGESAGRNSSTSRAGIGGSYGSGSEKNTSVLGLGLGDDNVDDLGEDLYAERRQELLEEEQYRAAAISKRKDRFMQDIDRYLKEHPPLQSTQVLHKTQDPDADKEKLVADRDNGLGAMLYSRPRRRVEFDASPTYMPEANYKERLMGLWRDMNKCRYLRVPDEMIDLSGINTLAVDTMKLYQLLRQREMEPLSNAWAE